MVNPIVRSIVNPRGGGFAGLLNLYPGAEAAYSLRALSSGWLAGDVVEVRPSHGAAAQSFTASQITSGAMLDFVNNGTSDLYDSARYFNGTSTNVEIDRPTTDSFEISGSFLSTSEGGYGIFSFGDDINNRFYLGAASSGRIQIFNKNAGSLVFDETVVTNYADGSTHTFSFATGATGTTLTIDGSEIINIATQISTGNYVTSKMQFGCRFTAAYADYIKGTIYNIAIDASSAYTGLGTSVTAWEDTIGSNDGTETNGAAYTGQPFDGFVSKWYDQSGNGNDAIQITTTSQPKIVSAGVLVAGGLDFDGVDDSLVGITNLFSGTSAASSFIVGNADSTAANEPMFAQGSNAIVGNAFVVTSEIAFRPGGNTIYNNDFIDASTLLLSTIAPASSTSADVLMFLDGSAMGQVSTTSATLNYGNEGASIGGRPEGAPFYDGKLGEIIIYPSDQSANRAAIEANINDFYSIY